MAYKTVMTDVDTAQNKIMSFPGMGKMGPDSTEVNKFMKTLMQANKQLQENGYITTLTSKDGSTIVVEMRLDNSEQSVPKTDTAKTDSTFAPFKTLMMVMGANALMLRGVIDNYGEIKSFYLSNGQKNLIALWFQLPGREVKIGDIWPLDVHLVSADQNFICDSSYRKNEVKVVNISRKDGDEVVTLQYDIIEYISGTMESPFTNKPAKTTMNYTFQALANFSIAKGKWINYNGIMSINSTGMISMRQKQRFALIPQ